jgi:hypothetical protein
MTLSDSRLHSLLDRKINECAAVGGKGIGTRTELLLENQSQSYSENYKSHMTRVGMRHGFQGLQACH